MTDLPVISGVPINPSPAEEVSDAFKRVDRSIDILKKSDVDYKAHETMLQRFTGYLLKGGTVGTSIDEIGVLSREMLAAAIGDGEAAEEI